MAKKYEGLFEQANNLTTLFLAKPMMYHLNTFGKLAIIDIRDKHYDYGFKKSYLSSDDISLRHIYSVYNSKYSYFSGKERAITNWEFFYDSVLKSKHFIEEMKINEEDIAFKLKFPDEWTEDFHNIIQGRYTKLSKSFMRKFFPDEETLLHHLYHKTNIARDYYSQKFNVNPNIFDDCEFIGPKMVIEDELFKIRQEKVAEF